MAQRLDAALVARGLVVSRERAQEAIHAGLVKVNDRVIRKPSRSVGERDRLEVVADPIGFVGRGGKKLAAALDRWQLGVRDLVCLDVGASTGGFTDCLLQRGARRVYAVDVGFGQMDPLLARDERVVLMEKTDIRSVEALPEPVALAAVDVSFISLRLVLPAVARLVQGDILCLVKPQFEVGPEGVGKGGVVRDSLLREQAVALVMAKAIELGLLTGHAMPAPVSGHNQEYWLWLMRPRGG